jgi:hypothetical protein
MKDSINNQVKEVVLQNGSYITDKYNLIECL